MEHFDEILRSIGEKVDQTLAASPKSVQHLINVCLKIPVATVLFWWMELAPYYNNWILDLPFLCVRYIGMYKRI